MNESALKFMTLDEVADLLRVSLKTVQRWRMLHQIRVHKAGRRVLVLENQLLQDLGMDPIALHLGLADAGALGLNQTARARS
ncbi:MAG TPA: helix-turn-helix domain-containing protein [bacterium]|jgi:excisionase family DNA binding protein|nr:helix-turn-helix domain-containing protein [bacterium]